MVGGLGTLLGDHIVAGRIMNLLAQVATGAAIYVLVARLASGGRWAASAALLFGAFATTLLRRYLGINDPQWLGHAAMVWALVALVPPRPDAELRATRVIAAAALMLAGGLIKHNLVAIPIAATAWLWFADRRAFAIWIVAGGMLAAAACGLLFAAWGSSIFVDVLAPARGYSLARMAAKGGPLLLALLPAAIACRPLLTAWHHDIRLALPLLLMAVAIPIGVVQRAGSGVDVNAFFEAIIAVAIAVPVACALRPIKARAWLAVTLLPVLCLVPVAMAKSLRELTGRDAAVRRWQPFIAAIAAARGPVACDDQAVCYWAGRQSGLDFFSVKQRLLEDSDGTLGRALADARFAMIEMRGSNPGWQGNPLIPAIRARYRVVYRADGDELLIPRR